MSSMSAGTGTARAVLLQAIPAASAVVLSSRSKLSLEDIGQYFHLPIAEAASNLGDCTSVLKRICLENDIVRWPYWKLESSEGQGYHIVIIPFIGSNSILLTFDDDDDCKDDADNEIQCSIRITNHGLLSYDLLPASHTLHTGEGSSSPTKADCVKYQLQTLPVDTKCIADGDTITVYVDTADPREKSVVPQEVNEAVVLRARAREVGDFKIADALHKSIVDAGYRVIIVTHGVATLGKRYKIRFRGIYVPESEMAYGKESKEALTKLVEGKRLKINIYCNDQYGRFVGDIYCNDILIQEEMLKNGFAMHYRAYDERPEFAAWEREA